MILNLSRHKPLFAKYGNDSAIFEQNTLELNK